MPILSTRRRVRRTVAAAATVVAVPFALGGCSGEDIAEKLTEKAIEQGNNGDVDVDLDHEGGIKVESSDGSFTSGTGLPDGFPEDDIPLIGKVVNGAAIADDEGTRWSVTVSYDDGDRDEALEEAVSELEGAGFAKTDSEVDTPGFAGMKSDEYEIVLTASDAGDGTARIGYIVVGSDGS